jgi:hypothetical protein
MIQQEQDRPIDRSQDVQVADIGRIGDPGSGVYYDPSVGAYRVSDVEPSQEPLIEPAPPTPTGEVSTLPEVTTTAPREVLPGDLTLVGDVFTPTAGRGGAGGGGTARSGAGTAGTGGTAGVGGAGGDVSQGTLPPVTVTGTPEVSPDDLAIIDLITPREEVRNLPEVTVTPGPEEPERDFDFPDLTEEGETVTETEVAPDEKATPYKPELFITGSKSRKPLQPRSTTRLGGVAAFAPQTGLSQALTAVRPAGETEGTGTGRERQQVWNEASLRLKDALGL